MGLAKIVNHDAGRGETEKGVIMLWSDRIRYGQRECEKIKPSGGRIRYTACVVCERSCDSYV